MRASKDRRDAAMSSLDDKTDERVDALVDSWTTESDREKLKQAIQLARQLERELSAVKVQRDFAIKQHNKLVPSAIQATDPEPVAYFLEDPEMGLWTQVAVSYAGDKDVVPLYRRASVPSAIRPAMDRLRGAVTNMRAAVYGMDRPPSDWLQAAVSDLEGAALAAQCGPSHVAHSKSEYKRLSAQGADVLPPNSAGTPITDSEVQRRYQEQFYPNQNSPIDPLRLEMVTVRPEFARQLERELYECRDRLNGQGAAQPPRDSIIEDCARKCSGIVVPQGSSAAAMVIYGEASAQCAERIRSLKGKA